MNNTTEKAAVEDYYDDYIAHQKKIGISVRHRTIAKDFKKLGIPKNAHILEIGCGIGTVSSLLVRMVPNGSLTGCDISPKSIETARELNPVPNAEFICTDMSDFTHTKRFDYVVFPDVLEHIPVEQHYRLFENVAKVCSSDATFFINIPEPNALAYYREHNPELLQIIDQSLSMQDLLNNTYPHGFKVVSIRPYALGLETPNYLSIVMRNNTRIKALPRKSKAALVWEMIRAKYF